MNTDRFFERDADGVEHRDEQKENGAPSADAGATDVFGTVSPALATEWATVPEVPTLSAPVPVAPPTQEPVMSRTPLPVVHEVIFKAGSSSAEGSDSLRQLLQSAPPAQRPSEVAAPVSKEAPSVAPNGGFTQLLRALNYDQVKPVEALPMATASVASPTALPLQATGPIVKIPDTVVPLVQISSVSAESTVQAAIRAVEEAKSVTSPQESFVAAPSAAQVTSFRQPVPQGVVQNEVPATPVSFTQLFSSLDIMKTPAAKVEEAPSPIGQGGFTQMFEALGASKPVTSPVIAPLSEPAVPPPVQPTATPGSFTQMFQTLDAPSSVPVREETSKVEPALVPESFSVTPPIETARIETPAAPTAPGSFTQLFQAPVAPERAEARPVVATPSATAAAPGSFTQMFQTLDKTPVSGNEPATASVTQAFQPSSAPNVDKTEATPQTAAPGSFTGMFSAPAAHPVVESRPQADPPASAPGSFTQMFRALDAQPTEPVKATPSSSSGAGTPGTFTQMFGTLSSSGTEPSRVEAQPARAEAGSFTQLFGTLSDAPPQQTHPPAPSFAPPVTRASEPVFGAGGVSQVFSTQQNAPEQAPSPSFSPREQLPPAAPVGGGLTQLLRTLDHSPQPPVTAPQAFPPSAAPSPLTPSTPPVSAGPSEFTRILNASMLRESALRGGEVAPVGTTPQAAPPAPAMGLPPIAMPPAALPAMPSGGGAPPQWAMQAPAMPQAPAVPQVPQVKAPEAPKPTAGKMQQMLPLLLILIIFVLIAVLVAVIILMKH